MSKIHFIDVTNRDTVQASRMSLSKLQRTLINMHLGKMGIYQSEFAFPFAKGEQSYIRANLGLKQKGAMGNLILEGWCRATPSDVGIALASGVRDLNLSISTSDQMLKHKFGGKLDRKGVIQQLKDTLSLALTGGANTVGVNAEDSSRTDLDFLINFALTAKEAGASRFRYCDTLGYETPDSIYDRVRFIAQETNIPIELHCHNDLGMAVANSIAGAKGAVDGEVDAYINTSINGWGERAGQADLVSCILGVKFGRGMEGYEVGDDLDLKIASKLARYTSYAFKIPVPLNQPGVGENVFAHEAGIHADGALKDHRNYELYDLELLGLDEEEPKQKGRIITTGEYGGLSGFKHVYQRLGVEFSHDEVARGVLEIVRYASAHNQLPLTDDELRFIAQYPEEAKTVLTVNP
jgi:homocitrate synthase NifV